MFEHDQIRRDRDRRFTTALLAALHDPDERDDAALTLAELADPRAESGLTGLVVSPSVDPEVRTLASRVLHAAYDPPAAAVALRWWERGDRRLRAHALAALPAESTIVLDVADAPEHPLHRDAIAAMTFGYQRAAHQTRKIAALGHADAAVRAAAAIALLWDEPCAAEDALIAALDDRDDEVADEARQALSYYGSRRALRAVVDGPGPRDPRALARAREAFAQAIEAASPAVRAHLAPWLAPVQELLSGPGAAAPATPSTTPSTTATIPAPAAPSSDELLAILAADDGPWTLFRSALLEVEPGAIAPGVRPALTRAILDHADADVRRVGARWTAAWGDRDALDALLDDPAPSVRAAAVYATRALPADPALARRFLDALTRPGLAGFRASEMVEAFDVHGGADALTALRQLVTDEREPVAVAALVALERRGDRAGLAAAMGLLDEAPAVTWGRHAALLGAAARFGLPASLAALADVDDLAVQLALAELATAN